jgi:hypothetical protein
MRFDFGLLPSHFRHVQSNNFPNFQFEGEMTPHRLEMIARANQLNEADQQADAAAAAAADAQGQGERPRTRSELRSEALSEFESDSGSRGAAAA